MSMQHRAFEFNWNAFRLEILDTLQDLESEGVVKRLSEFIDNNIESLTDPYEGEPLDKDWRDLLETGEVIELADFALTKYYDVNSDFGLADLWLSVEGNLSKQAKSALLGQSIDGFDPGCMGSYFQSGDQLQQSVSVLSRECSDMFPDFLSELKCKSKGLYVTF